MGPLPPALGLFLCSVWLRTSAQPSETSFLCTQVAHDPLPKTPHSRAPSDAKDLILELREQLVQQRESILDLRETVQELTAKLAMCEAGPAHSEGGRDHQPAYGHHPEHRRQGYPPFRKGHPLRDTMGDLPRVSAARHRSQPLDNAFDSRYPHPWSEHQQEPMKSLAGHITNQAHDSRRQQQYHGGTLELALAQLHQRQPSGVTRGRSSGTLADRFQVSFPLRTNYMYVKMTSTLAQEVFAFTVCLHLKTLSAPVVGTPFSYAVLGEPNELVLTQWGTSPMHLLINDKMAGLPLALNDSGWHHVCITWSIRDGTWEAYQDGSSRGKGDNLAPWHPIKLGGVFVLGQEQDAVEDHFDASQAFVGALSDFQMWDRVLPPSDIESLAACSSALRGNLVAWTADSVELHGGVVNLPFNHCHEA
ncbi:neuronal pentraxin-1-like [Carcharodon carcharias]|uniref:neuronal pentraxin-1-like n=1 Tax=Carcharodon carcharias TaxID=13397 RepID=UPI001B7DA0C2|nr:neuronal pentraxin-1-like [Carcharodon carcharias]